MNQEQIAQYFGKHIIYQFYGSETALSELLINNSYNYIKHDGLLYFVADNPVDDLRVTILIDNREV